MSAAVGSVRVLALDSAGRAKRLSIKGRRGIAEVDVEDVIGLSKALESLRRSRTIGDEIRVEASKNKLYAGAA